MYTYIWRYGIWGFLKVSPKRNSPGLVDEVEPLELEVPEDNPVAVAHLNGLADLMEDGPSLRFAQSLLVADVGVQVLVHSRHPARGVPLLGHGCDQDVGTILRQRYDIVNGSDQWMAIDGAAAQLTQYFYL